MLAPIVNITDINKFCEILSTIEIHNYTQGGKPIAEELTLMPLFQSLLCCDKPVEIAYRLYDIGTFTEKAKANYFSVMERVFDRGERQKNLGPLIRAI